MGKAGGKALKYNLPAHLVMPRATIQWRFSRRIQKSETLKLASVLIRGQLPNLNDSLA